MPNALPNVERLNRWFEAAWEQGLLTRPSLDADTLVAKALRKERAESITPGVWTEPYSILTQDLVDHAALNPVGQAMAHGQLVGILRQRIRIERAIARHPAVLDRPIASPVVILGQMRSGTTRLHRLLACDRRFAACTQEEVMRPMTGGLGRLERRAVALAVQAFLKHCNPALGSIHPGEPGDAEEEAALQANSFLGALIEAQWFVPRFAAYWRTADRTPAYRELKTQLQLLGWLRGDAPSRTRLLKAPQFLADLDALLTVLPDARLIGVARDPTTIAASGASLVWHQRRIQSDSADKRCVGAEWLAKTEAREAEARATLRRRNKPYIATVDYDEIERDWRGAIRRLWAALDMVPDPEAEVRMKRFLARPKAHRGHRYDPAQFGLDPATQASRAEA